MSVVVDVDRDHCSNCLGVSYYKMERSKLQFGWYEQTELCHLLWMDVTVEAVECATGKRNKSNCNLDAMS